MSSKKYKMCENLYARNVIHIEVDNEQVKISDFVRQVIADKDLSYRKVANSSGGLITHSTVSDVINERISDLTTQTIAGLAKGLGVTETEIYWIVRKQKPNATKIALERFDTIANGYGQLSDQERANLEPFIKAIETATISIPMATETAGAGDHKSK